MLPAAEVSPLVAGGRTVQTRTRHRRERRQRPAGRPPAARVLPDLGTVLGLRRQPLSPRLTAHASRRADDTARTAPAGPGPEVARSDPAPQPVPDPHDRLKALIEAWERRRASADGSMPASRRQAVGVEATGPNTAAWSRSRARVAIASPPSASLTARSTAIRPGSCPVPRGRSRRSASVKALVRPVTSASRRDHGVADHPVTVGRHDELEARPGRGQAESAILL